MGVYVWVLVQFIEGLVLRQIVGRFSFCFFLLVCNPKSILFSSLIKPYSFLNPNPFFLKVLNHKFINPPKPEAQAYIDKFFNFSYYASS